MAGKEDWRDMLRLAKWICTLAHPNLTAGITQLWLLGVVAGLPAAAQAQPRVLVYTRNYTSDGKGYVHANIADSVAAIKKMGAEKGFVVDVSDDPATFTEANLKQYAALIFSNSNNEAFSNDAQRSAFKHYIQAGGGFVGIHSASGSERDWPYFSQCWAASLWSTPECNRLPCR